MIDFCLFLGELVVPCKAIVPLSHTPILVTEGFTVTIVGKSCRDQPRTRCYCTLESTR